MDAKKLNTTTRDEKNSSTTAESRFTASDREQAVPSTTSSVYMSSAEASARHTYQAGANASVYNSSTCEIDCDPCSKAGDYVLAEGYCSECNEYYCQSCYHAHSRSKATKDHTLMDQSTMPTISTTFVSDAADTQFQDEFHFKRDINSKHPNEEFDCYIVGMTAVTDNELVIVDGINKSAKMIDFGSGLMVDTIRFDSEPCNITTISKTQKVAITFLNEHMARILSTCGGLSVERSLKLGGLCLAVQYCNDKLYVSYQQPVKFQIISLSGGVIKTFKPESKSLKHRINPRYIAVHHDESKIYVSDWKNKVVLCMDMNGTMITSYKDVGLEHPTDITFSPFGSIYLCNRNQSTVYMIPEDLGEARVILGKPDGIQLPQAMCFCHSRKYLFVSSGGPDSKDCDVIKVYQYA